jgi:hypothetical protein
MKPVKFFITVIILFDHGVVDAQTKAQKIDKLLSQYHSYGQFNGTVDRVPEKSS